MLRLLSSALIAGQLCLLSAMANADPVYVGPRYANPESETFGNVMSAPLVPVGFLGPARNIGPITGDPEKDTVAFQSIVIVRENQPAFGSRGARELQGIETVFVALVQPAFGANGARELRGLTILLIQPADGARGARELQLPELYPLALLN